MASPGLKAFVKFCNDPSHIDDFVSGRLFMRRLSYFQRLEQESDDGRPDPREAVVSWHQPDKVDIEINIPGYGSIKLGKDELAGPISITQNFYSDVHVFCMTAISIPDPSQLVGDHLEVLAQLRAAVQVDPRNLQFGPHAVLVPANKFLAQLNKALANLTYWRGRNLVEYYDETTFHGDFDLNEVLFRKQSNFAYQKEFRVCLQTPPDISDPFFFDIGDMSSFAYRIPSEQLNECLHVDLKDKA